MRLWLSGMCRSQAAQSWTIAQITILLEVTQAHLFRDKPHTSTSLAKELNLPLQTVSRTVLDLINVGLVKQKTDENDGRKKYIHPTKNFFARDAMPKIAENFASQWYYGWGNLDKAKGANWYFPMSKCSDPTAKIEIKQFKEFSKAG
jgi:predicted transcriptional regulator